MTSHPAGVAIAVAALLLFIMVSAGLSSCGAMFSGMMNGVLGTSYTSEDSDLVAVENNYAAKENELQQQINNIERDHPGYDEYRYDLASIGHNPHELASYLTALLQSYTPQSAQAELNRIFEKQYTLTLTEEVEIRYRTETRTDHYTDAEGNSHTDTYTVEVPYEYYILNVKLTNKQIGSFVSDSAVLEDKKDLFKEEKPSLGKCPRCGNDVCEGKKNYYCSNRDCGFVMWKNDRFFEERKTAFTPKIAAALLKSGRVKVKKLYSPKTGKTYDGTVVLADTGAKYVNYRIEIERKKELE